MIKNILFLSLTIIFGKLSADNTIIYTTTDSGILSPNKQSSIDGSIISNNYKNGQGQILFSPDNGKNITNIGSSAFAEPAINTYFDPKNGDEIKIIGKEPFPSNEEIYNHTLQSIILPEGVTTIGNKAFANCSSLEKVALPSTTTKIEEAAFINDTSLTVISGVLPKQKIYPSTFENCWHLKSVDLSNVTDRIGKYAFRCCLSLSSIEIPEGIKQIEDSAFFYCGATSLVLPQTLDSIGRGAFQGMPIVSVSIPNTIHTLSYFSFAFTKLKHVSIPSSVKILDSSCFECCYDLESLDIPASVSYIGHAIVANCPSFKYINYKGTIEQWNAIPKDSRWYKGTWRYTPLTVIHCSDGDIEITPHYEADVTRGNHFIKITDEGWSTLCLPFRFFVPNGLTVYSVNGINQNTGELKLSKLTASINNSRGNYPYLVKGAPGYYLFTGKINKSDKNNPFENGLLRGSADAEIEVPVDHNYVLQRQGNTIAFFEVNFSNYFLPPHKAYLHYEGSLPKAGAIIIETKEIDDLQSVIDINSNGEARLIYSLIGNNRSEIEKGINIIKDSDGKIKKIIKL